MTWRVLGVATISLGAFFSWQAGIWSWLMPLLIPVITILMLLMIAPCIVNCLRCFVSAQVHKLQHAVPVQQGYINLHLTMEDITHPQMDTTIRTLKLETSKRERPYVPCCPSSAGSSKRDLDAPIPKELGLPSFEEGILGSQNQKKESKIVVAKRQRKKKPTKVGKECPRTGVRTLVKKTALLASPIYTGQAQEEEKKNTKRGAKIEPQASLLFVSFGLACPHTSRMYFTLLAK